MRRERGPVWWILAALTVSSVGFAQEAEPPGEKPGDEQREKPAAESESVHLEDVVVTARRFEDDPEKVGRRIAAVSREEAADKGGQTLPDALNEEPGVWVQKTGLGGGSPFIRGLTGNRVLWLIDGVRFNNSTFRYGPNQYPNTIDVTLPERMEVLYGPGSAVYGSDAIGGVVNVLTWPADEELKRDGPRTGGRIFSQYSSADRGILQHLDYAASRDALWCLVGATYSNFDDLRAGRGGGPTGAVDTDGAQSPTGYEGTSARLSLRYAPPGEDEWRVFYTMTHMPDVPRSDKTILSDRNTTPDETYLYDPQDVQFGYVEWRRESGDNDYRLNVSYNRQLEGRTIRKSGWTRIRHEEDDVSTPGVSFSAQFGTTAGALVVGAEAYQDSISSSRYDVADGTGVVTVRSPQYPDGSRYLSSGVFANYRLLAGESGVFDVGLRYSLFCLDADFDGMTVGPVGPLYDVSETYRDLTWEFAYSRPITDEAEWYASVARGFRAPNTNDVAVSGAWSSGVDIPNVDLEPEKVLNYELGIRGRSETWSGALSVFWSVHDDLITRQYADPGADGIPGTGDDLYQFRNVDEAEITGVEASVGRRLYGTPDWNLGINGTLAWTYGQSETADEPVSRIPPLNGTVGLRLDEPSGRWWSEFFAQFADRQDRLSASDEADTRIPVGGTPGWATLNLRGGIKVSRNFSLTLGVMNLGDVRYRVHSSGIDAPGTNAVLSASWTF